MARKSRSSIEAQREALQRKYVRGPRRVKTVTGEAALTEIEREMKQTIAVHLSAAGFSYAYIAEVNGVHEQTVKNWFGDEKLGLAQMVAKVSEDYVLGAVKLGKTYLLEIMEGLMEIFRTTEDEKIAKEIGFEFLDRFGITKVNKSASVVESTNVQRVEITDTTGLLKQAENAPPHVQAEMAAAMDKLLALGSEYGDIPQSPEVAAEEAERNGK